MFRSRDGVSVMAGNEFCGGPGSVALVLALRALAPSARLCIVGYRDFGPACPVRAGLLVSGEGPAWIDAEGLHALEGISGPGPVIREADETGIAATFGRPDAALKARAEAFMSADPRLSALAGSVAAMVARGTGLDPAPPDRRWTSPHPDAPPGGGPGWQDMASLAGHALDVLGEGMDEGDFERFEALAPPMQVRILYTRSDCDDFAVALHRVTGWPLVAIAFPDEEMGVGHHTMVRSPDGSMLDAGGWSTRSAVKRRYGGPAAKFSAPGGEEVAMSPSVGFEAAGDPDGLDDALCRAVSAMRQLPWAPFDEPGFRERSLRPLEGVDLPLPDPGGPAAPCGPG